MATVSELIAQGHKQVEDLRAEPYAKHKVDLTLDAIQAAIIPARAKISEALTILRDPALLNRPGHRDLAAAQRLEEAMRWLNGKATVMDRCPPTPSARSAAGTSPRTPISP